tara:strand:+ start:467 stop:1231 length:765 start_codon:yes stop_codon:yes gene_type:complete
MPNQQQQQIPDLGGIITQKDLYQKGKFDYCAWAKTAQIIREKAPNWFFSLEPNSEGEIVWKAPNNTGFMMGYFQNIITGIKLPLFPYAITDFNNRPIVYEKISSNDIQNSQRRHLCACACYSLGFGHELWAQIEIKGLDQPETETNSQLVKGNTRTPKRASPTQAKKVATNIIAAATPLSNDPERKVTEDERSRLKNQVAEFMNTHNDLWGEVKHRFNDEFGYKKDEKVFENVTQLKHYLFLDQKITGIINASR